MSAQEDLVQATIIDPLNVITLDLITALWRRGKPLADWRKVVGQTLWPDINAAK
jgi:hypothetical protein